MTTSQYYVEGVPLVNCGGEMCEACGERKAVGWSIGGSAVCARCAGAAATDADEYAAEVEASRERQREQNAIDLARIRAKMIVPETVRGDRQRGRNGGKARRANVERAVPNAPSPRRGPSVRGKAAARKRERERLARLKQTGGRVGANPYFADQ